MYNLHYSTESRDDLTKIKEHISVEFDNPTAATRIIAHIVKRVRGLKQFPEMGALLSSIVDIDSNYRYLVCKNYLVFYRIDGNDIYIIRAVPEIYNTENYSEPSDNITVIELDRILLSVKS